jgi:hypothetical protein
VQLGPLASNGGTTQTHALLGGEAIDTANSCVCFDDPIDGVDQRGATRDVGGSCDIGAYEAPAFVPDPRTATPTPTPTATPPPTATPEPQPDQDVDPITPPSTGDGGLR